MSPASNVLLNFQIVVGIVCKERQLMNILYASLLKSHSGELLQQTLNVVCAFEDVKFTVISI